jgi:tryptophan synthase alpha chain
VSGAATPTTASKKGSRIAKAFESCRERGEGTLVAYLMAGDPTPESSRAYLEAALASADVLEIGIPFSDPVADGPTIQRADVRALAAGTTIAKALELVRTVRTVSAKPIVLMTYANPVHKMGYERFAEAAASAGVDGVILPDVPLEESQEPGRALRDAGVDLIQLVSPATSEERIGRIAQATGGFLYVVSLYGVTGAREGPNDRVRPLLAIAKKAAGKVPVAVGFGVAAPEHVRAMLEAGADGVVVGSALVSIVERGGSPDELRAAVQALKAATMARPS